MIYMIYLSFDHSSHSFNSLLLYILLFSNVDEVVRFSGQAQRRQLTYATKQLIGREVSCTYNSPPLHDMYSQSKLTVWVCIN